MVIGLIWALEVGKLGWHRGRVLWWLHALAIVALLVWAGDDVTLAMGTVSWVACVLSYVYLPSRRESWWSKPLWMRKRRGRGNQPSEGWILHSWERGPYKPNLPDWAILWEKKPISDRWHVLSFLSSWPVEIAAMWSVYPLW